MLNGESMRDVVYKMITDTVENTISSCIHDDQAAEEWDVAEVNRLLLPIIPLEPIVLSEQEAKHMKRGELIQKEKEAAVKLYEEKETQFAPEQMREIERVILLRVIDTKWMQHIDDMDQLRQGIGLQAYAQHDPLVEYKLAGYEMFEAMTAAISEDTVRMLMHIRVEEKVEREEVAKATGTNRDDTSKKAPVKRATKKIMPNDPCPCGSGKKYKFCHGRTA